jgi:hypothetical protein
LKVIYGHSESRSCVDEHRKALLIMFGGSCEITSRRIVKTLHREVTVAMRAPRAAPHHKWMEMPIGFDASDCPMNMVGVGQLPLLISPTIANIKFYHVLVDGGVALNLISLATFKKLQISMSKLTPSCPFLGVGLVSILSCGSISLLVMFRTPGNYRTESVLFDVAVVNLPFNAILSWPALNQFMAIAHYGYMVLKMSVPNSIIKICGDCMIGVSALEKLHALVAAHEAVAGHGD